MKIRQVVALSILTLVGASAEAETDTSKEEGRGMLAGAVIGAGVGGPFGAGLGAIIGGGILGKLVGVSRINKELVVHNKDLEQMFKHRQIVELDNAKKMKIQIANLSEELKSMLEVQTASWNSRQLPIQFRTGSSEIESQYRQQLEQIARILSRNVDTKVGLSGFADRRGDSNFNQILSESRVSTVQSYLLSRGVNPNQILTNAFGESQPISHEESFENNFFDRRVVMQFSFDIKSYLASR
ncbi:MAG: sortase system peptidoglycan-associated protein [Flavobacterium sp.]|jgi:sortase system peptidoglycan-associated protein